jgi:hypothetical protein
MLNDEHKKKIKTALKVMEDLIKFLDGAPYDPRVITLIDVAASYLDEQYENSIEYPAIDGSQGPIPEDEEEDDSAPQAEEPEPSKSIEQEIIQSLSAEEYMNGLEQAFNTDEEFKFLSPTKKPPKLEQRPMEKFDGDSIAEEIQRWYSEGEPDQWPAE